MTGKKQDCREGKQKVHVRRGHPELTQTPRPVFLPSGPGIRELIQKRVLCQLGRSRMTLPLSFARFSAPESESVIRHLDVIRIRHSLWCETHTAPTQ
jgi:hypothetical protein